LREQYRSACREIPTADGFADGIPDPALCGADAIAQRQMQQEVRQTLDELSEKDRRLMKALFLDERDKDEVCRDFGVDREYLRVLVYRAKQSFKSRYLQRMHNAKAPAPSARMMSSPVRQRTHHEEELVFIGAETLQRN
jgi:RNA polymerase sigma-70 factor, ECF subfamily